MTDDLMNLNTDRLERLFPNARPEIFPELWTSGYREAELTNTRRLACFLAQTAQETGGYRWLRELGSPIYFKRYEGRRDLGNSQTGDGYAYRGGGLLMLTGRRNYERCGNALGVPLVEQPDLIVQPDIAVRSACWFWMSHNCNHLADAGDFLRLTRIINGGLNGIKERRAWLGRIETAMGL